MNHTGTAVILDSKGYYNSEQGFFGGLYQNFSSNGNGSNSTHLLGGMNSTDFPQGDIVRFAVEGVGIIMIAGFGVIGNVFSVFILCRPQMRSSISSFLIGLGVMDSLLVICSIWILGIPAIFSFYGKDVSRTRIGMVTPYVFPVAQTAHMGSVLFTMVVTIERYYAVCHPLKFKIFCTVRRAYYMCLITTLVTILYNVPTWFEYTYTVTVTEDGVVHYIPKKTDFGNNKYFQIYYQGVGTVVFGLAFPSIVLIAFNIIIYRAIRKANSERRSLSSSQQNENSLATMLLVVVLVFFVCHLLSIGNIIAKGITGKWEIPVLDSIRNFMIIFNSSVNFIIYCIYGTKFRGVVVESFSQIRNSSLSKLGLIDTERKNSSAGVIDGKFISGTGGKEVEGVEANTNA